MKKFFNILSWIISFVLIFLSVILVLSVLPNSWYKIVVIRSGSMEPNLSTGSLVIYFQAKNYSQNDIIAFRNPNLSQNIIIIHRIIEINASDSIITKGDANPVADFDTVRRDNILGKVIFSLPYAGFWVSWFDSAWSSFSDTSSNPHLVSFRTGTWKTDNTPPQSSLTVTRQSTRDIHELILNGGFENDVTGWQKIGNVDVVRGTENGVTPFGDHMLRIGSSHSDPTLDGSSLDANWISQKIPHLSQGNGLKGIGLWYNFLTYENNLGFDRPGFMILAGNRVVHQVWADEISDGDEATLEQTGWKFLSLNLDDFSHQNLTLFFYAGNTEDLKLQSFVYIDNIGSNEAVVNQNDVFHINSTDNEEVKTVYYEYKVEGEIIFGSGISPLDFSLNSQPDDRKVEYWAKDTAGNVESRKSFGVVFDDQKPESITDLSVIDMENGDFDLSWTAVNDANDYSDNRGFLYDLRYSKNPISTDISDSDWALLPKPSIKNADGLPGGSLRAPLYIRFTENYKVHVNDGPGTYYFALKVADMAHNWSNLMNESISTTEIPTLETQNRVIGDVVINEIMWMGSTQSTADEWLELRNLTDKDIDLTNWRIEGLGSESSSVVISSGTLKANGYFVIANYSKNEGSSALLNDADFITNSLSIRNEGEQLILKDNAGLVVDSTPLEIWPAGENLENKQSMERNTSVGEGTDVNDWHTCNSLSCREARALYWKEIGSNYGTPGGDNLSLSFSSLSPKLGLDLLSNNKVRFYVTGVSKYFNLEYVLTYKHEVDGQIIEEAIVGQKGIEKDQRVFESGDLFLGTCSSLGQVCISHQKITNISLTITLKNDQNEKILVEKK